MRSLKVMKAAPTRTRRLARDMIIFWKKWDKEQVCFPSVLYRFMCIGLDVYLHRPSCGTKSENDFSTNVSDILLSLMGFEERDCE